MTNQFRLIKYVPLLACLLLITGCGDLPSETEIASPPNATLTPRTVEARPAEVGVGLQGQSLKNESGVGKIIAQPAITLFQTKEKIAFEILIPKAVDLFKASEGRLPESHEEFMEKIVKFNQIQLPKLPAGQVYRYRPDDGRLWVEPLESTDSK